MISSKNDDSMNSTFGNRAERRPADRRPASASDATPPRAGIRNGDRVRAFNDRGSMLAVAEVDGSGPPGVVRAPSVRWNKSSEDGRGVNALTSDRLTDIGGGPTFYNCLIEVARCGD